jgi:hypothetical protein
MSACARCGAAIEVDDLRCSICSLVTQPVAREAPLATHAQVLRCQGCGAAVTFVVEVHAPQCTFCASVMKLEAPSDPIEKAEWFLPFLVSPEQARVSLRAWLRTLGWFRPADLVATAEVDTLKPLWWAAWIIEANAMVSWAADSNAGSGRSAWAPHAGKVDLDFDGLVVSASRGLRSSETHALTRYYDLRSATKDSTSALAPGPAIEGFELQRSAARRQVLSAIEATAAARVQQQGMIPGSRFRNVHVSVLLRGLRTLRTALPTYVLAYRYRGKLYRALVHGQDARCVLGEAPYSIARIALAILGALVVVAVILAVLSAR